MPQPKPDDDLATAPEDYELLLPGEQQDLENQHQEQDTMGREEQTVKREGRRGDAVAYYAAMGAACVSLLVSWLTVLSNSPFQVGWFAWHPTLQSLAMALFTYGILTLQPTSQPKTKAAGLSRHQVAMFVLAFPIVTFGTFAIVWNKYIHDKSHFKSLHGQLGLLCMIWMFAQIIIGGGSVWGDGALFGGGMKAKMVWRYHRISGYILFPLLLLTVNLGGWSGWGSKYVGGLFQLVAYTVAPLVILVAVGMRVRWSKMNIFHLNLSGYIDTRLRGSSNLN